MFNAKIPAPSLALEHPVHSSLIDQLNSALQVRVTDAQLIVSSLPDLPLKLWLIDPSTMQRPFSQEETQRLLDEPPYWCFCWASGLALAQWILQHPEQVAGKRVIDVGAGSGIVALAAKLAGAKSAVACDLDLTALQACRANAELNQLDLSYSEDLFSESEPYDVLFAADVLYDAANLPLLKRFADFAKPIIMADSRQRNFQHALFRKSQTLYGETLPDLAEPAEFRQVSLYQSV